MESQEGHLQNPYDKITQLREENRGLVAENQRLQGALEKQAAIEKRYEESQERFKTIFEQSKFGNKIITSDLRIIQVNTSLHQMLGYSKQELVGTKITDYSHPEYIHHWHDLQENLWTRRIPSFQIETCLVKKEGATLWCEVTSILFKDHESTLGYTTLEDITERKILEETLAKQTDLINRDLDNFIYIASHDLKTPIVNIEGLLLALTNNLAGELFPDAKQNQLLSMIGTSSDRLKATIADLTQIAQVQKETVEAELVGIDGLIDEVYQDLGALIGQLPVKLSKHMEVGEIRCAKKYLQSILYHLLSNAIKYRSDERTPEITIETHRQGKYLILAVADNGLGIAPHHLPKLFTMFKRFHTHVAGTGIGLYMVKRMIEKAGGKIEVESQLDVGTTFRVYLPLSNR